MSRLRLSLLPLIAIAVLAVPAGASADSTELYRDCSDGALDGSYSNSELKKGLDSIPSDLDEYSDCRELISGAIKSGSDKGGGRRGSDASSGAVAPDEQTARTDDFESLAALTDKYGRGDSPRIEVGGETVEPGKNGLFEVASASNGVPTPLLLALIAILLLAIAGSAVALRSRIPALSRIPGLSKLPTPSVRLPGLFRR